MMAIHAIRGGGSWAAAIDNEAGVHRGHEISSLLLTGNYSRQWTLNSLCPKALPMKDLID